MLPTANAKLATKVFSRKEEYSESEDEAEAEADEETEGTQSEDPSDEEPVLSEVCDNECAHPILACLT